MKSLRSHSSQPCRAPRVPAPSEEADPLVRQEPTGHVHPNFRHWVWFRPHNL